MAGKLDVEIVTGERVVFQDHDVDMVIAPGGAGVLGILPQHAPLITTLSFGELRIKKGNDEQSILVYGGFMEVGDNKVLILADSAERAEEIDEERAQAAKQRAEERLKERGAVTELDAARVEASLRRAMARLSVLEKVKSCLLYTSPSPRDRS